MDLPVFAFPPKYFAQVFVVKVLIHHQQKYLLMQEPPSSSWKPGKWGLPGGKLDPKENWLEALDREVHEELGVKVTPKGLLSLEEIVYFNPKIQQPQLTHHVVIFGELDEAPENVTFVNNTRWHTLPELQNLSVNDLTEFYYPQLWKKLEISPLSLVPLDFIHIVSPEEITRAFTSWYSL